jgi:5-formaminoimidazole-4-carboxamide-1-beta-D-ribofuranosyl 5'-monophosphate synthetase
VFRSVLVTGNLADLALARSILEAAAVRWVVRNEHALLVPLVGCTELLVDVEDEETAVALLRHAGLIPPETGDSR